MISRGLTATLARGGSSRGLLFREIDVAEIARADRPAVFRMLLGSPDPSRRQVNGVGGGTATTNKVAVVGPATRVDADLNYEFYQFLPDTGAIDLHGTCGNMSSAAAQFAIQMGLVTPQEPRTVVRLHDLNTDQIIVVDVEVRDGEVVFEGPHRLAGVPGTGSPIGVRFPEAAGHTSGSLLPTGELSQTLASPLGDVTVSLIDVVNPVVLVHGASLDDLGFSAASLSDLVLAERLASIRRWAAVQCGFVGSEASADVVSPMYPFVGIYWDSISPSSEGLPDGADLAVRLFSGGSAHAAVPLGAGLASASLAALRTGVARQEDRSFVLAHPSGSLEMRVASVTEGRVSSQISVGVTLTARPIMSGTVWMA